MIPIHEAREKSWALQYIAKYFRNVAYESDGCILVIRINLEDPVVNRFFSST
jgi:hypothetical protein